MSYVTITNFNLLQTNVFAPITKNNLIIYLLCYRSIINLFVILAYSLRN